MVARQRRRGPLRLYPASPRSSQLACCYLEPRDEGEALLFAVLQHVLVLPVAQIVKILDTDDIDDLPSTMNFGGFYLAKTNMTDLSLFSYGIAGTAPPSMRTAAPVVAAASGLQR